MCDGALGNLGEAVSAFLNLKLDNYESLPGCWPPNTGCLQGQQLLLTIQLAFQSPSMYNTYMCEYM